MISSDCKIHHSWRALLFGPGEVTLAPGQAEMLIDILITHVFHGERILTMTTGIGILCFSPTNSTRKICGDIASGMGSDKPLILDMTLPEMREQIIADKTTVLNAIEHLIVGAPVYSGKLPPQVAECLRAINGAGKNSTAIVVYGNRDYGMALYNMMEILLKNNFNVTAAGAFIAQHSYSDVVPVALGRPDASDTGKARDFGAQIVNASGSLNLNDIPRQIDRASKSKKYYSLKPSFKKKLCIKCGQCVNVCPSGSLSNDKDRNLRSSTRTCIGCMACAKICKQKAMFLKVNPLMRVILNGVLGEASVRRKEPTIII
jgi:Pyruvate/2-oxoacid:ferredoxin oxidoreductase delta subunit